MKGILPARFNVNPKVEDLESELNRLCDFVLSRSRQRVDFPRIVANTLIGHPDWTFGDEMYFEIGKGDRRILISTYIGANFVELDRLKDVRISLSGPEAKRVEEYTTWRYTLTKQGWLDRQTGKYCNSYVGTSFAPGITNLPPRESRTS